MLLKPDIRDKVDEFVPQWYNSPGVLEQLQLDLEAIARAGVTQRPVKSLYQATRAGVIQ
ncbi:hypothetical protein FJT64_012218 [Amphibalanus amphitrite]|uniref:Uncharacterized protein n=1 Tax=Amphibalanus amphitrite TaxID=1232801 RepID=A0A6A4VGD3_AMPAM|nr:hypothetical protein FJT64_012218 [Amphibalanus amphitrite]